MIYLVKVRKKDGRLEEFDESKIASGVRKAGATAEEAAYITQEVSKKVAYLAEVASEELSDMVVASLSKINKAEAEKFVQARDEKLKAK